jgi:hypothetical protein
MITRSPPDNADAAGSQHTAILALSADPKGSAAQRMCYPCFTVASHPEVPVLRVVAFALALGALAQGCGCQTDSAVVIQGGTPGAVGQGGGVLGPPSRMGGAGGGVAARGGAANLVGGAAAYGGAAGLVGGSGGVNAAGTTGGGIDWVSALGECGFTYLVTRTWDHSMVQFPSEELPEAAYSPLADGPRHAVRFSTDAATAEITPAASSFDAEVAGTDGVIVGTCYTLAPLRIAYGLDASLGGGRFIVWTQDSTLQAELTYYGSGVPIIRSTRGVLTPMAP